MDSNVNKKKKEVAGKMKRPKDNKPLYHPDFPGGGEDHPFHGHFLKTERGKKWSKGEKI